MLRKPARSADFGTRHDNVLEFRLRGAVDIGRAQLRIITGIGDGVVGGGVGLGPGRFGDGNGLIEWYGDRRLTVDRFVARDGGDEPSAVDCPIDEADGIDNSPQRLAPPADEHQLGQFRLVHSHGAAVAQAGKFAHR